jgi:transposase
MELVILLVSWGTYRIPVAIEVIDPNIKGHQNILFREMLERFNPPKWARSVIVEVDSGFSSNQNIKAIEKKKYYYVCAIPRTRKFTNDKYVKDLVKHLPKNHYHRVATRKLGGRRKDYWVYSNRAKLNGLGEVTILLSKRRLNDAPKNVKIIVTNLKAATEAEILTHFAQRWTIEVAIKELKSGLHLGQMQVTRDPERIKKSVALSVAAYLLLVHLYGGKEREKQGMSLFKLKQRFTAEVYEEALEQSREKWKEKLKKLKAAA